MKTEISDYAAVQGMCPPGFTVDQLRDEAYRAMMADIWRENGLDDLADVIEGMADATTFMLGRAIDAFRDGEMVAVICVDEQAALNYRSLVVDMMPDTPTETSDRRLYFERLHFHLTPKASTFTDYTIRPEGFARAVDSTLAEHGWQPVESLIRSRPCIAFVPVANLEDRPRLNEKVLFDAKTSHAMEL